MCIRDRGNAGGNAGAGQWYEHAEQNLPDVAAQILRGLDAVSYTHLKKGGEEHMKNVVKAI